MVSIAAAALKIGRKVHSLPPPGRHADLIRAHGEGAEGFVLSDGRFVGRSAAAEIALASGQVAALQCPPYLLCSDIFAGCKSR